MYEENEDTDPGLAPRKKASKPFVPFRTYFETTKFLGHHRRLFLPLGVLALMALGIHAAADRFDDWAFLFFDHADRLVETLYGAMADAFLTKPDEKKLEFGKVFDLATKEAAAGYAALAFELILDLRLGLAALGAFEKDELGYVMPGNKLHHRLWAVVGRQLYKVKRALSHTGGYLKTISVEKIWVPLAVGLTALAGAAALYLSLDNAFFAFGRALPHEWRAWQWLSPTPSIVAAVVVMWRLGIPATLGSVAHCQRVVNRDIEAGEGLMRRLLRGTTGALLLFPLLLAGLWAGTPLGFWFGKILAGSGP